MKQPKQTHKILRHFKYYLSSMGLISLVKNWPLILLGYLNLLDFKKGIVLKLNNGLVFKIKHFLDAVALKEVYSDSDYRFPKTNKKITVIDIGANTGTFSVYAAKRNNNAKIISFEPSRSTFQLLKYNLKANGVEGQVLPNQFAVSGKNTKLKLYNAGPSGLRSLYQTRQENKYETVQTITLKRIFSKFKIKSCDYLKVDCEGAEYDIFKKTPPEIFNKIKRISLEFHEMTRDQDHHQLIDILKENGFKTTHKYNQIENNIGYIYAWK